MDREKVMKIVTDVTRLVADMLMHYVCMRLRFRSSVLKDSLPEQEAEICLETCCPAKG